MIIHRAMRDIERCREKYGKAWEEYEREVPYLFIPVCGESHGRCEDADFQLVCFLVLTYEKRQQKAIVFLSLQQNRVTRLNQDVRKPRLPKGSRYNLMSILGYLFETPTIQLPETRR